MAFLLHTSQPDGSRSCGGPPCVCLEWQSGDVVGGTRLPTNPGSVIGDPGPVAIRTKAGPDMPQLIHTCTQPPGDPGALGFLQPSRVRQGQRRIRSRFISLTFSGRKTQTSIILDQSALQKLNEKRGPQIQRGLMRFGRDAELRKQHPDICSDSTALKTAKKKKQTKKLGRERSVRSPLRG